MYIIFTANYQQQPKARCQKSYPLKVGLQDLFFIPEMIRFFPTNQKVLKQAQWCLYLGRIEQPGWGIVFTCIQALGAVLHFYGSSPFTGRKRAIGQIKYNYCWGIYHSSWANEIISRKILLAKVRKGKDCKEKGQKRKIMQCMENSMCKKQAV